MTPSKRLPQGIFDDSAKRPIRLGSQFLCLREQIVRKINGGPHA
jgi:hypothetical protein